MWHATTPRTRRVLWPTTAAVLAAVAGGGYAVAATSHDASTTRRVEVKTAESAALGKTILVSKAGRTLYSLSAETHGRFICTAACLTQWKPLVVPRGTTPTGAAKLATTRRPDGRFQVTYRGLPLYTFSGDHARGDVSGNGFKDVGTWKVATLGASAAAPAPPTGTGGGGGYGGGY